MEHYQGVLKKYAVFTGRASRTEFWYFVLFNIIVSVVLGIVDGMLGTRTDGGYGLLSGLYSLAVLVPSFAVGVRRLHDTNRSGWWSLISLVPLIGITVLIVFFVGDSTTGDNQYGQNPKGAPAVPTTTTVITPEPPVVPPITTPPTA